MPKGIEQLVAAAIVLRADLRLVGDAERPR
jgi:hypothetical protein